MSGADRVIIIIGGGQQARSADYGDATVVYVQDSREAIAFLRAVRGDRPFLRAWQAIKAAMNRPHE